MGDKNFHVNAEMRGTIDGSRPFRDYPRSTYGECQIKTV